jgi:3-methyladenine DNA glycosylase AlkD
MKTSARVIKIERQLKKLGSPARARASMRFFKTGPGQYGEGDQFIGLNAARIYATVRECGDLTLADVDTMLHSPWHEVRLVAVVLLAKRYPRSDARTQQAIYSLYVRRAARVNNWDLVDSSAPAVVGGHLRTRSRAPLHRLAKSRDLWERRIAIVATQHLIRHGQFADTLRLAVTLINDEEDLIHKAVGWMLREVGKRDEPTLRRFLNKYAARLPRTALRYSLERLSPRLRKHYMEAGK